ncbi:MAG: (2Fe-2S)-binding protein [Burkholderiales bacterium]|nr:(2Fe-2S)-binding protein [Burkholderiales bacterium]
MIVCVCNNVSDKKIQHAVKAGMTTMSELREHLEVGTCCGKCAGCAKQILRESVAQNAAAPTGVQTLIRPLRFQPEALAA